MDNTSLIWLLVLTFAGGLIGSIGMPLLLRNQRVRSSVIRWKWWGMALHLLVVGVAIAAIVAWVYHSVVRNAGTDGVLQSPWMFFAVGVAAGLPFSLTSVFTVRHRAKQAEERKRKRKAKPASRQERVEFAQSLERQLRDYSDDLQNARVVLRGDNSTVLAIHGNLARDQAERLVNLLRGDLQDLGIQRVESGDGEHNWWVRV